MKTKHVLSPLLVVSLALWGCGANPGGGSGGNSGSGGSGSGATGGGASGGGGGAGGNGITDLTTAFAQANWSAAADLYAAQLATNPSDAEANFGRVLGGLLSLPEASYVDDALAHCGQAPIALDGLLFGLTGLIAWEAASRLGDATLTISENVAGSWTAIGFSPHAVRTSAQTYVETYWEGQNQSVEVVRLRVVIDDVTTADGGRFMISLGGTIPTAEWTNGLTLTLNPDGDYLPTDPARYLYMRTSRYLGDGSWGAWASDEQGTLTITQAGKAKGESIEIQFTGVALGQYDWATTTLTEIYRIDGTVSDTVDGPFEIDRSRFPFSSLDNSPSTSSIVVDACFLNETIYNTEMAACYTSLDAAGGSYGTWVDVEMNCDVFSSIDCPEYVDYWNCFGAATQNQDCSDPNTYTFPDFSACTVTNCSMGGSDTTFFDLVDMCGAGLNELLAFDYLDQLFAELRGYEANLDAVVQYGGDSFTYVIPADTLFNPRPITVGIAAVRALRATLGIAVAGYEIVRNYHYFVANFEDMIVLQGSDRVLDASMIARELNISFLAAQATPIVLTAQKQMLRDAITDLIAIVDATPAATAFFSAVPLPTAAKAELRRAGNLLLAALDAPQPLPDTPEYSIDASAYFNAPFHRDSILSQTGLVQLFNYRAMPESIDIAPELGEHLADTFVILPADPPPNQCVMDNDCFAVNPTWVCNDWRYSEPGFCEDTPTQACADDSECTGFYCRHSYCGNRPPVFFDPDPFQTVFDGRRMPTFFTDPDLALEMGECIGFSFGNIEVTGN